MNRITAGLAAATLLVVAWPAFAETDVESELAKMKEAMQGLQEKVQAQEEQLQHQKDLLQDAQTAVRDQQEQTKSLSGLSEFVDMIEVDGHVAGSYNYNLNDPDNDFGGAGLNNGLVNALPFHPDHNTFVVDQVWFGLGKPATEESPAGFRFDILYGNTANFLGQGTGFLTEYEGFFLNPEGAEQFNDPEDDAFPLGRRYTAFDSTSDYYIAQAYVEYTVNAIADGLNFKFGKFQTPVGGEVVQTTGNYFVTRGIVYTLLQPVDHLGLLATQQFGNFQIGGGVVNSGGSAISSPDVNEEKSYIGTAAYGDDRMSLRGTFVYGAETAGTAADDVGLADVTAFFNPTDNVSLWANYNYLYGEGTSFYANGVAVAGRVGLTDRMGVALRGEYVNLNNAFAFDSGHTEFYSVTGTLDYALTDHLLARAEVRFDTVHKEKVFFKNDTSAFDGSDSLADNQTVGLVEVVYEF